MFFNNLKTIHDAITELMQMDPQAVDQLLSDGHNWATDHMATSADDIEEVYHFLNATLGEHEPDSYDGETEGGYEDEHGSVQNVPMSEAEYKGKKVTLGKPTHGDVKKFKVYVKNAKGNVVRLTLVIKRWKSKEIIQKEENHLELDTNAHKLKIEQHLSIGLVECGLKNQFQK